jgi:hypothetical protein
MVDVEIGVIVYSIASENPPQRIFAAAARR